MGIVHKSCMSSQSPVNLKPSRRKLHKTNISPIEIYIAPSSGHTSFNFNMPCKLFGDVRLFSNVGVKICTNMEIHNSPQLTMALTFDKF